MPIAPKKIARSASSRLALGVTITALLPPNSMIVRPNRRWTVSATCCPILQEPVAEINGRRASAIFRSPTVSLDPIVNVKIAGSTSIRRQACSARRVTASAVSGVLFAGFHTTASPHTTASAEFQAQTATGKLKAVITPTTPSGCHCSCKRCLGRSDAMVRP